MTYRYLRPLFVLVPVFVAVGIVAACGTYPPPTCTTPAPQPQVYYYPAPGQQPVPPPSVPIWNLSVLDGKLQLQTVEGARSICERLTVLVSGVDPVEATVAGQRIQIAGGKDTVGSTFLQASADRVTRTGAEGAVVSLEGNAKLVYARNGKKADISADRIAVNLATGQITSEMDVPQQVTPIIPPPVQPVGTCPSTPAVLTPLTSAPPSPGGAVGDSSIRR